MELNEWIDKRIESMLERPLMWGGNFCVETGIFTLLEIRYKIKILSRQVWLYDNMPGGVESYIDMTSVKDRFVLDEYAEFLKKEVPECGCGTLTHTLERLKRENEFGDLMRKFVEHFKLKCTEKAS